jgi:hypothetical protein
MTDLKLNFLKSDELHVLSSNSALEYLVVGINNKNIAANKPFFNGISYYNGYVYACDWINKSILKFDANLVLKKKFQLTDSPFQIQIVNEIVCISVNYPEKCIYFHDLSTFNVKSKYEGHHGITSVLNGNFYEYWFKDKKFNCYNEQGSVEEINTDGFSYLLDDWLDGSMVSFNGKIVVASPSSKKLVEIDGVFINDAYI